MKQKLSLFASKIWFLYSNNSHLQMFPYMSPNITTNQGNDCNGPMYLLLLEFVIMQAKNLAMNQQSKTQ